MIEHTFAKNYENLFIKYVVFRAFWEEQTKGLMASKLKNSYETMDRILKLWAIIEEAWQPSSNFWFFVRFWKAFYSILRALLL